MRFYDGKVIAYLDITSSPKAYEVKINPNTLFKRLTVIGGKYGEVAQLVEQYKERESCL